MQKTRQSVRYKHLPHIDHSNTKLNELPTFPTPFMNDGRAQTPIMSDGRAKIIPENKDTKM